MKQKTRSKEDEDVFEFRDEYNPEDCHRWSKICSKFGYPNPDNDDDIMKYQFLQNFSSRAGAQIKDIPIVTLDDDDDDDDPNSTDDSLASPLDSTHKAGCELSDGFYSLSGRPLEQPYGITDSSVDGKTLPPCMQTRVSTQLGPLPENSHISSINPESPCCDDTVDIEDFNGNDIVEESCCSATDSEMEENYDPIVGQAYGQSIDSEMDATGSVTVAIHTDYVAFRDKYFPASLILISRDSVKMKGSDVEDDCAASSFEWKAEDILKIETQLSSLANVAKVRIRLLTKDAESANRTPVAEMLEFLVPNWSQQQKHISSLDLSSKILNGDAALLEDIECSSNPFIPSFEDPFEVVYLKGEIDAVSIRKSDVDRLKPDVFVNDTIIDFYTTYLKNGIPRERRNSFHFFSSFFFRKLADLDKNPSSVSDGKAAFQRVLRWTRKVNIFEKDYIFIPVNYNLHWSLIVLCHPGEIANFNVEHINEASKVPCILHMDSIRGSHTGLKDLLQSYLLEEWKERKREPLEDISSNFLNLRFVSLELPQQENCSDCGLFLLHYAELFVEEAPLNFSPFQINKFDRFLKQDWFLPAEASLKRVHIQRLIHELLKSRSHECDAPSRNTSSHSPSFTLNKEDTDGIQIASAKGLPEISLNGGSLYLESPQDMDIGLLDVSLHRPSNSVDNLALGRTELLEHCERYNQGASLVQLGFSPPSTTGLQDVEDDEPLPRPDSVQTGLQSIDRLGESYLGSSSGDFDQTFQLNMKSSDRGDDPIDASDSRDCYHSFECNNRELQSVDSCENENLNQLKKIVDSQEGYASASSEMMETPPEDSKELAEKYGNHDQVNTSFYKLEEVVEESLGNSGINEDEVAVPGDDEKWIVEESPPDQFRPSKRLRVTLSGGELISLV